MIGLSSKGMPWRIGSSQRLKKQFNLLMQWFTSIPLMLKRLSEGPEWTLLNGNLLE
jgi:hypothetical protein